MNWFACSRRLPLPDIGAWSPRGHSIYPRLPAGGGSVPVLRSEWRRRKLVLHDEPTPLCSLVLPSNPQYSRYCDQSCHSLVTRWIEVDQLWAWGESWEKGWEKWRVAWPPPLKDSGWVHCRSRNDLCKWSFCRLFILICKSFLKILKILNPLQKFASSESTYSPEVSSP